VLKGVSVIFFADKYFSVVSSITLWDVAVVGGLFKIFSIIDVVFSFD